MSASRREAVVEDVEWLLSWGVVPESIAHRLGYASTENLIRSINRWGYHDLGNQLAKLEVTYIACHIESAA